MEILNEKTLFIICFFVFTICFSQNLEETIYLTTEAFNKNQNSETLRELDSKIRLFETELSTKDEYYAFINLLANKAYYLAKINNKKEAINSYEKAHGLYIKHTINQYDIIEYCLIELGTLYHKTNAYIKAENIIKYYIELAEKQNNKQQQITGITNLAKLYQSLNRHKSVIQITNRGLKISGIKKQQERNLNYIKKKSELLLKNNQEKLYLENDLIVGDFKTENAENLELSYLEALKNEDYKLALHSFNKLKQLKITKLTSTREVAKFSFQQAQLYFLLQQKEKALKQIKSTLFLLLPNYNNKTFPTNSDLYAENIFLDIFDLWAELQTNPIQALKCYDLSFYVSNLLAQQNTNQESVAINANLNRSRSEKCISILYQLYSKQGNSEYFKSAFRHAESFKGSALKWYSNKRELLHKYPKDSLLIEEKRVLKQQQQLTNRLLNRSLETQSQTQDSLRFKLIAIDKVLNDLQISINTKYPEAEIAEINIEKLKLKLNTDNACLVEFFYGKNVIYQFIITKNNFEFNSIELSETGRKAIANFIDYFNDASAINNDISKYTSDAFYLYKFLHLDQTSTYKNVIIVPDGFLNFIPFESLLTESTSTLSYSKMPFVIKKQNLAYNISAQFYIENKPYKFSNSALGVFPVFDNTNQKLTYSLDEMESLKIVDATFLEQSKATKKNVLNQLKNHSILHFSTHANSGNFNEPAYIEFIDAKLYVNDLYNLDLSNDLVILSACETGVGLLQKGEGSINLTRGFKYAGIDNIVFSLWKINDLSTSIVMGDFYKNLVKTESAFIANQSSKLSYLENAEISNIKKSPYYWSSFMYYGDLTKQKEPNYLLFISIGLCVVVILLFVIWNIKNRSTKRFSSR
ncbi:hypothetical protein IMCC3317_40990 [Kordia antarctica]|uniref:CHAT domain-containing protein n=1 Tax=Kordia antarctica TaxID=1218801 RepID=A0A7L4ZPZ7_9FLAO|nr:CHAT domain-containing protein [Kordia antarctica]QHI38705.1 hypothetical protein IMCC3317_40990 [Kordia antarctica]